jgi:hypothetical protein
VLRGRLRRDDGSLCPKKSLAVYRTLVSLRNTGPCTAGTRGLYGCTAVRIRLYDCTRHAPVTHPWPIPRTAMLRTSYMRTRRRRAPRARAAARAAYIAAAPGTVPPPVPRCTCVYDEERLSYALAVNTAQVLQRLHGLGAASVLRVSVCAHHTACPQQPTVS